MKLPIEWEEEDLLNLIEIGAEEDSSRDWKEARALSKTEGAKSEIGKDISSFANSDGGYLVYGLSEDDQPPHKAAGLSPIDPRDFPPEWLENIIQSRIKPPIQGLKIKTIRLKKKNQGKIAYVVYAPRSTTVHQASDKRYYKRYNFQSAPMEDYEIRLAMHRASWPTYDARLEKTRPQPADGHYRFKVILTNTSDIAANNVSLNLLIPSDLVGTVTSYAEETIDVDGVMLRYTRIPGSSVISAHPGDPQRVIFEGGFLNLPKPIFSEGQQCTLVVRVYDGLGRAHEGRFTVVLSEPLQILENSVQRPRELIYS